VARKLQQPALKYRFQENGTQTSVWAENGKKVAPAGTKVPVPRQNGTQTSVWAESGKKVATAGTEVPVPKQKRNPYFSAGFITCTPHK